jgi:hypothetical protein
MHTPQEQTKIKDMEYNEYDDNDDNSDNDYDVNSCSVARWAVEHNYVGVIQALIQEKRSRVTLEDIAEDCAVLDRLDVLKYMLFLGVKPTFKMLEYACRKNAKTVWPLLYNLCRPLLTREDIQDLIRSVCEPGHVHIIRHFMAEYPNILKDTWYKLTYVCAKGHLDVVKLLVEEGDADIHQDNDYSVLCALKGRHLTLVKYLVSKGANLFAQGDYAINNVCYGDIDMVDYLLEQGLSRDKIPKWYVEYAEYKNISFNLLKDGSSLPNRTKPDDA